MNYGISHQEREEGGGDYVNHNESQNCKCLSLTFPQKCICARTKDTAGEIKHGPTKNK